MLVLALVLASASASFPPLAAPPLGYSTWQWFPGTKWGKGQGQYNSVDEVTCRTQADAMVEKGLVAAGYNVFIVDEPCFAGRDASGELIANSTTWPSGFAAFGKYLADRGMQLGIYTDAGPYTCQGCPASAGHEEQDMATFISWGASYVKVDRCFGVDSGPMREALPTTFAKYRTAANKASHRVQVSAILAATDNCWEWCNGTCDHCRTTEDIRNSYGSMSGHVDAQESIPFVADYAGPGYFNDLDMMVVGNMSSPNYGGPGLTPDEVKTHISLWAVLKSPMLLSCDVRSLDKTTLALLTNKEMLKIFNDPLAAQAKRIASSAGSASPTSVTFDACPTGSAKPLDRQQWVLTSEGHIASKAYVAESRVLTLQNCGASRQRRLQLCSTDPKVHGSNGCTNTSCPTANSFNVSAMAVGEAPTTITNAYNQMCMEGMLGPGRSSVVTNPCKPDNIKQAWTVHSDGTIRASNGNRFQCLTAELGRPSAARNTAPTETKVDIYAGELANGDVTVVFYNRDTSPSSAAIALSALPGFSVDTDVNVFDVWANANRGKEATQLRSGTLPAHGVVFLRLSRSS